MALLTMNRLSTISLSLILSCNHRTVMQYNCSRGENVEKAPKHTPRCSTRSWLSKNTPQRVFRCRSLDFDYGESWLNTSHEVMVDLNLFYSLSSPQESIMDFNYSSCFTSNVSLFYLFSSNTISLNTKFWEFVLYL